MDKYLTPSIRPKYQHTRAIMADVIIALLPLSIAAGIAFGGLALQLMAISITASFVADFIFSAIFLKKYNSVLDGSALITGLLLSFTISPLTPWYVVVFGAMCAILLGKTLWGGLGKNRFNPALIGREFMAIFFASTMTSPAIWDTKTVVNIEAVNLFPGLSYAQLSNYLNGLIFKTSGAMGEYSVICILIGGAYLVIRKRISWHIPVTLLVLFSAMFWLTPANEGLKFSLGGVLLGAIYMATDMPSSPTTPTGKIFYGGMIGLTAFLFIACGISNEYMSYSILLLNAFSDQISIVFKPRAWGASPNHKEKIEKIFFLTLNIFSAFLAILALKYYGLVHYLIYIYMIYVIFSFKYQFFKKTDPI